MKQYKKSYRTHIRRKKMLRKVINFFIKTIELIIAFILFTAWCIAVNYIRDLNAAGQIVGLLVLVVFPAFLALIAYANKE